MKKTSLDLADSHALLARVRYSKRPIVFMFGSAMSHDPRALYKVAACADIVTLVRRALGSDASRLEELLAPESIASERYQICMRHLLHERGVDAVNAIIREAVAMAYKSPLLQASTDLSVAACERLERDLSTWSLGRGLDSYAAIKASGLSNFDQHVLTTNFDPLIEISLRRMGVKAVPVVQVSDGSLSAYPDADITQVVHLHGHWYLSDTQHTVAQLSRDRPRLRAFLRRLLERRTLVVMGYGGWHDVLVEALSEVAADDGAAAEILWSFYSADATSIEDTHGALLKSFGEGAGRGRILYYGGVDAHEFFCTLERGYDPPREEEFTQQISAPVETEGYLPLPSTSKAQYLRNPGYILDITGLAWIVVRASADPAVIGKIFKLERRQVFAGRSDDCDIRLAGKDVSRRHALLERRLHRWDISNKSSTNGLFVDGAPVAEAVILRSGCHIGLGHTELLFTRSAAHASDESQHALASWVDRLDGVCNAKFFLEQIAFHKKNRSEVVITVLVIVLAGLPAANAGVGVAKVDSAVATAFLALNAELEVHVCRMSGTTFAALLNPGHVPATPIATIMTFLETQLDLKTIRPTVSVIEDAIDLDPETICDRCLSEGRRLAGGRD